MTVHIQFFEFTINKKDAGCQTKENISYYLNLSNNYIKLTHMIFLFPLEKNH